MTAENPRLGMPFEAQFHAGRAQEWVIQNLLRKINTAQLVKVVAVEPTAGTVGFVDVVPMLQQTDTRGVLVDNVTMFRLPYLRAQGGKSALILDPAVDDIGLAVFSQRDITATIATRELGAAPTNRAFDAGDGLYLGGFLNADPTQYIEFLPDAAGIKLLTPGDLSITCSGSMDAQVGGDLTVRVSGAMSVEVGGNIDVTAAATTWAGPVTFADPITAPQVNTPQLAAGLATIGGVPFTTHKHISAASGSPTGGPIS